MAKNPFKGFTPLSSNGNIYLYTPSEPVKSGSTTTRHTRDSPTPDLIILSTWMGALPKHILKYTAAYQSSYPTSTLVVITNDILDIVFRPNWLQRRRAQAAIDFIHDFTSNHKGAKVLLHSFSNGGGQQVVQLARGYRTKYKEGLPITALALDSCPGAGRDFAEGMKAIVLAVPPALRFLAKPVVFLLMCYFYLITHLFRMKNVIDHTREGLLDEDVVEKSVPRVYIYSKEDKLVGYQQVEEHAAEAKKEGYRTERVEFTGSGHVQHMMQDPETYWGAITNVLKEAEDK